MRLSPWFAAALLALPFPASADNVERDCRLFIDKSAARVRAGEIEAVKRDVPRVKFCQGILKAAVDRDANSIVKNFDAGQPRDQSAPALR